MSTLLSDLCNCFLEMIQYKFSIQGLQVRVNQHIVSSPITPANISALVNPISPSPKPRGFKWGYFLHSDLSFSSVCWLPCLLHPPVAPLKQCWLLALCNITLPEQWFGIQKNTLPFVPFLFLFPFHICVMYHVPTLFSLCNVQFLSLTLYLLQEVLIELDEHVQILLLLREVQNTERCRLHRFKVWHGLEPWNKKDKHQFNNLWRREYCYNNTVFLHTKTSYF